MRSSCLGALAAVLVGMAAPDPAAAQPLPTDPSALLREWRWRPIGPYRGGRTKAAAGIPDQPGVFYVGVCNGGVWKSDDYGRTWRPLFDDQPTGSIGALAIAASDPRILYVGSGEGLHRPDLSTGDGMYKSTDGGQTWRHLGLRDAQQITQILVDPRNADRLFVAVLGHPYGPSEERGIFRSLDGGRSFQKVLYHDADTGGADLAFDPTNPDIVYAVLWEARQGPWENAAFDGPGSGLYKSTDGGSRWRRIGRGLPTFEHDGLGRIGITVAPSRPQRLFATVEAKHAGGLYRSDDGGESFARVTEDTRVTSRADDFAEVKVHPQNPDVVFTATVVVWKSQDGGKTWSALRGAPGGDDYHRIWINPRRPEIMLVASDQGALVTTNGGRTWSSWYNQPTAQMFHVTADRAFPYRVCGGQQESGSACVASRGPDGQITFREWHPAGLEEYGYAAPDPLDPDLVYGGKVSRYDRRTGQTQDVSPRPLHGPEVRTVRTQPLVFSPVDPRTLYFASNQLWKTRDGGRSWTPLSPDLTRKTWTLPTSVAKYAGTPAARPRQRGVIYTIAPSPLEAGTIWVGTDDGLIHRTRDGGRSWQDVTPPDLVPWAKVSLMDAGHSDARTAYAAVNTLRLDDLAPHVYRTHDGGRSWTAITSGLPPGGVINVVREDPRRKGLLFCGSEQAVYVSFDDGDHWQSLRLNMPATSIRDLIVKDDDLVVATHGRGFWILDDITALRELTPPIVKADAHLFRPAVAVRVRWNTNTDTPLPPDEPAAPNPPDGAILDYVLGAPASAPASDPVTLEILDAQGALVRRYSSQDRPEPLRDEGDIPRTWIRPTPIPSAEPGLHRFVWDLHYPPPAVLERVFPIAAVAGDTPREPRGPWAPPGRYLVRLTAQGRTLSAPLVVRMDPRVKTPAAGLRRQFLLSQRLVQGIQKDRDALEALRRLRAERKARRPLDDLDRRLAALEGGGPPGPSGPSEAGPAPPAPTLVGQNARLAEALGILQDTDAAPTAQAEKAVETALRELGALLGRWEALRREAAEQGR